MYIFIYIILYIHIKQRDEQEVVFSSLVLGGCPRHESPNEGEY